jgi:hypothetical protein
VNVLLAIGAVSLVGYALGMTVFVMNARRQGWRP